MEDNSQDTLSLDGIIRLLELEEEGDKELAKKQYEYRALSSQRGRSVTGRYEASEVTLVIRWKTPALRDPDKSTIYLPPQGPANTVK